MGRAIIAQTRPGSAPLAFIDWAHIIPGLTGGVVSSMVCYPLELCETHLQARPSVSPIKRVQSLAGLPAQCVEPQQTPLRSLMDSILEERGIPGLFDGIDGALWSAVFGWMAYFATMTQLDAIFPTDLGGPALHLQLFKTTFAGLVAAAINTPFQNIKTKRILDPSLTTSQVLRAITMDSSQDKDTLQVSRLWTGLGPCFLGVSTVAVQFTAFFMMSSHFAFCEPPAMAALFGGVSMCLAGLVTYPAILLKTMAMAAKDSSEIDGILGWYNGITPYMLRTVPPSALLFAVQRMVECSSSSF